MVSADAAICSQLIRKDSDHALMYVLHNAQFVNGSRDWVALHHQRKSKKKTKKPNSALKKPKINDPGGLKVPIGIK